MRWMSEANPLGGKFARLRGIGKIKPQDLAGASADSNYHARSIMTASAKREYSMCNTPA
jgi:hypothetical protein